MLQLIHNRNTHLPVRKAFLHGRDLHETPIGHSLVIHYNQGMWMGLQIKAESANSKTLEDSVQVEEAHQVAEDGEAL